VLTSCSTQHVSNAASRSSSQAVESTGLEASLSLDGQAMLVTNQVEYASAIKNIQAGQTIVLANGVWHDFEMLVIGKGTQQKPIRVMAQQEGKVILSGLSSLSLYGEYLEVSGLVFKNGYSPTGVVISYRAKADQLANHSRVTRTVIDGFSNPDKFSSDYWVALHGRYNRFDHNHLQGKNNAGVTMAVRLDQVLSQQNYHSIDHNYFGPRPILGSNGGETLRIGTSKYSLSDSFTTVENNYFDRANGEVEIISNKSGKNVFKNNTFFESRGTLTLRHGNGNVVEGNVFFGNGKDHTGGIRVINGDQTIRNNYMEGLTGIRFGGGLVVLNGVPNSKINRYHQVDNALIENNTIVNVSNINLAAGSDAERTAIPINSRFSKNLIVNQQQQPFKLFDDMSGITFADNIMNHPAPNQISGGFEVQNVALTRNQNGLLVSATAQSQGIGADQNLTPIDKTSTGVQWYAKDSQEVVFSSGNIINVDSAEALTTAISQSGPGDKIVLATGEYDINKPLQVAHTLTIAGENRASVMIFPGRTLLAELQDGASLRLESLTIDGNRAPDSAGNVLVRNSRTPTLQNYRLELLNVTVKDLNVNHSAHVFDAGYRSMANHITISNSSFSNITGDILRLDKEQDDLGIYNVEYLTIENSEFKNVQGALAKVYRGGTDESTFGPHLYMRGNTLFDVGNGKRNKHAAAIHLLGVQDADIINNTFEQSQRIIIDHTVGEPQTLIQGNRFIQTALPLVTETFAKGPSTAILIDNTHTGSK